MTFSPLLFIPFAAPEILAISIPSFLEMFLNPRPSFFSVSFQYPALIIPVLFISLVEGLRRIQRMAKNQGKGLKTILLCLMVMSTLLCGFLYSPAANQIRYFDVMYGTDHDELFNVMQAIVGIIPEDASVSTQLNLLPLLSQRRSLYGTYRASADIVLYDTRTSMRSKDITRFQNEIEEKFIPFLVANTIHVYVNRNNPDLYGRMVQSIKSRGWV